MSIDIFNGLLDVAIFTVSMSSDFRISSNCLVNFVSRSQTMYLAGSG